MNPRLMYLAIGLAGIVAIIFILRQTANTLPTFGSDQLASTIYLGIWGSLVAAAVLMRGEGLGHTLKQLVAWLGIFLVVMAGYSYRYEIQDIAATLSGGLIPGSPISRVDGEGRPQITLIRDVNGHFNARGKIDGAHISFLIDTGATSIVLSFEDAARAGIDTKSLAFAHPVSTANGMTTSARTTVDTLSIGNINQDRVNVMVSKKGDLSQSLLGMSFINRLRSFEIRGERMILTQ